MYSTNGNRAWICIYIYIIYIVYIYIYIKNINISYPIIMCKKHVITCSNHQLQHAAAIHSNRHPPASPAPHVVQETRITSIRHFFVWKPWENPWGNHDSMIIWLSCDVQWLSMIIYDYLMSEPPKETRVCLRFHFWWVAVVLCCSTIVCAWRFSSSELVMLSLSPTPPMSRISLDTMGGWKNLKGRPSGNIGEWGVPSLGVPTHDSGNLHPQPSATSFHWDRLYGLWSTLCFAGSKIAGMNNISQHVCALWAGDATKAFKVAADPLLTWRWKTRNSSTTCSCIYFPHWTQDFPLPASVYWRV